MGIGVNVELLKEKVEESKEKKKQELAKQLEIMASKIRSQDELDDTMVSTIIYRLLDYKKACTVTSAIDAVVTKDSAERLSKIIELL